MTKALSTQTHVIVLHDNSRVFLTEEEATGVKSIIKEGKMKYLEIGDSFIMISAISRIVSGGDYEEGQRIKRGDWVCKHGEWHEKGEQCGHGL